MMPIYAKTKVVKVSQRPFDLFLTFLFCGFLGIVIWFVFLKDHNPLPETWVYDHKYVLGLKTDTLHSMGDDRYLIKTSADKQHVIKLWGDRHPRKKVHSATFIEDRSFVGKHPLGYYSVVLTYSD